jgi:DNA-binding transcriptional LysR family regulator
MKNIAGVDLNLMTAFEALMIEGHVTRAASRIGLAQPSMSNALARLRALFDDPLFVRGPEGMQPTEKARAIAPLISTALDSLRQAVNEAGVFDAARSTLSFRLATTDYGEFIVLPELLRRVRETAPNVKVYSLPFDRPVFAQRLERAELDLGLTVIEAGADRTQVEPQFRERFVCIARKGHPAIRRRSSVYKFVALDLDTFARLDHALVSRGGPPVGAIDRAMAKVGRERRVVTTVANFTTLMFLVAGSDLIAAVGERMAQRMADLVGVSIYTLPFEVDGFAMSMAWDRSTDADQGQLWFRDMVRGVCADVASTRHAKKK